MANWWNGGAGCGHGGGLLTPRPSTNPVTAETVRTAPAALPLAVSPSRLFPPAQRAACSLQAQVLFGLEPFKTLPCNSRGCAAGRPGTGASPRQPAGSSRRDSRARRLSSGFPEVRGRFQTLGSDGDRSEWSASLPGCADLLRHQWRLSGGLRTRVCSVGGRRRLDVAAGGRACQD